MKKRTLILKAEFKKVLSFLLSIIVLLGVFPTSAIVTAAADTIASGYQYHSTIYYDVDDPYNNVFGNENYAYACYISPDAGFEYTFYPVMFVHNGKIVRDTQINNNLFKLYFSQNGKNRPYFTNLLDNAEDYIEIAKAIKFGDIVEDVSGFAVESLSAITAIYLTGGTATLSTISNIVAEKAIDELSEHVVHIAQIIADAQLGYFYKTVAEMQLLVSRLNNITDFTSFANCEEYFGYAEDLVRATACAAKLTAVITEDLKDKDSFLEAVASLALDAASGFVGQFCEVVRYSGQLAAMQENPTLFAKIVMFAAEIATCDQSIGEYQAAILSIAESDVGDLFSIVEAYKARGKAITPLQLLEAANKVALAQHPESVLPPDNPEPDVDENENTYTYEVTAGEAIITGYTGAGGDVVIPSTLGGYPVTSIGREALSFCYSITSITIPDSVTSIGIWAFLNCSNLTGITVGENNTAYTSEDGVLFDKAKTIIIQYPIGKTDTVYTIPDSVTSIGSGAFRECITLTSITIPDSVTSVENYAFEFCSSLTDVWYAGSEADRAAMSIGSENYDLRYATWHYIGDVTEPEEPETDIPTDPETPTDPDPDDSLADFVIEDGVLVKYLGTSTDVHVPYGVKVIAEGAFAKIREDGVYIGDYTLENVFLPKTVEEIERSAFKYCSKLANIYIDENNARFSSLEGVVFSKDYTELKVFPEGRAEEYIIPSSVTTIGDYAFERANIPSVIIPEGVTHIGRGAFENCDTICTLHIPSSVVQIDELAFVFANSLENIYVSENNAKYCDISGILCDKIGTTLVIYPAGRKDTVVIPSQIHTIGEYAFWGHLYLTQITIPSTIQSIEYAAFDYCHNLVEITLPDDVIDIKQRAFSNTAYYNTGSNWHDGVLYIGLHLIDIDDINGNKVTIKEGTVSVAECYYYGAEKLTIIAPNSIKFISEFALYGVVWHCDENSYIDQWARCNERQVEYHQMGNWIVDPPSSCVVAGSQHRTCLVCNTIEVTTTNTQEHNFSSEWTIDIEASCTTVGSKSRHCLNCEVKTDVTEIPAAHQWSDEWTIDIAPTCTTGSKSHHCLRCDARTDITDISTGHTWSDEWTIDIAPTCTTGSKSHHCLKCDAKTDITDISTGHTWSTEWTVDIEETCTTAGSKSYHCLSCEEKTDVTQIPAAHKWSNEWTVDVDPTETTEGSKSRHCTRCDAKTDVTVIPMLGAESPAEDFKYRISNGEVRITGYIGTSGVMNIPAYIEDCPVTTIAAFAFSDNTIITKATIPYTVTNIEYYAFYNCTELIEVNLGSGITELPESLFSHCSKLQKVSLSTGLITIRTHAFYYCESLVEMAIPDTVEVIEDRAFYKCLWYASLSEDTVVGTGILLRLNTEFGEDVVIPSGVHTIYTCMGQDALTNTYVDQVTIPASLIHWDAANLWISALAFDVHEDNPAFVSVDGALYTKDMATIVAIPTRLEGTFTVPDMVTIVGDGAFYRSDLAEVILPDGMLEIGADAFCLANVKVNIPGTVTTIGKNAFSYNEAISEIVIPSGVQVLEGWTFSSCTSLTKITLPENLTEIGSYAFSNCTALTDVYYVGEQSSWNTISIDSGNSCLTDANIHYGQDHLHTFTNYVSDNNATCTADGTETAQCDGCDATDTRTVIGSKTDHPYGDWSERTAPTCTLDGLAYRTCSVCGNEETQVVAANGHDWAVEWTVDVEPTEASQGSKSRHCANCEAKTDVTVIPALNESPIDGFVYTVNNGTVTITDYTGTDTTVTIPSTIEGCPVTTIGVYAFADCADIIDVVIPNSVTVIGNFAFSNCTGLTDITVPDSVTYIGMFAFNNCGSLTDITIGNGVVTIGESAFSNCTGLVSIHIPAGVANIGGYVFSGCTALSGIWVDAANPYYSNDDQGVLYNKNKTKLLRAPAALVSIIVPDSVTDIGISAFSYSSALSTVTIPSSVTSIGNYAFYSCGGLTDVYYGGTESDRNLLLIGSNNDGLLNATWHYVDEPIEPAYISGDVNGDTKINNKDLGMLLQYLNNWEVEVEELACDVNRDGKINNKDLGILLQYLNNWDVELK